MKLRSKITIIILSLAITWTILINIAFGIFFQNFVLNQEQSRVQSIYKSLSSFLSEKENNYMGSVKDWAHWDATFNYVNNDDPDYIEKNLVANDFVNLDISFAIFVNEDDMIFDKYYYDFEKEEMTVFPLNFQDNLEKIISLPIFEEDTDGIYIIGNEIYFIAFTDITDSYMQNISDKKMVFGRIIDKSVVEKIEKITGCKVAIKTTDVAPQDILNMETDDIIIHNSTINKKENTLNIEMIVPYASENNTAVSFILTMTRDLYMAGMKNVSLFTLLNTLFLIILFILLYRVIGKYISKPFVCLLDDVKNIDLKKIQINKLYINEKDEFTFLRKSINLMLEKIEDEQTIVRNNEEKLYATLLSVGDGVITIGIEGNVELINPVAEKLTGWSQCDAAGKPSEKIFNIINEYTKEKVASPIDLVFKTGEIIQLANHTLLISKDGRESAIEDTAAPIIDPSGNTIGCVLVFRDTSEKKERQREIEYLSYHDQLTGLYNRRYFDEELRRLDTKRNLPLSIIFADVNGLKIINDAFGHIQGDQLIQIVAEIFKKVCRADDIISRVGGDEFILLLPKTDKSDLEDLVMRIREHTNSIPINSIETSVSFGWDTKNDENRTAFDVVKGAEDMMYQKKILNSSSKRNGIIISILNTLLIKSPREEAHSMRVSSLCEAMGKAYHLDHDGIRELSVLGKLHDIGKIAIDENILNNKEKLLTSEWAQIKKHPEIGYRLLGATNEFYSLAEDVLAHHERCDGTGYPKGLKGENISWNARVLAIADSYDAMVSERLYKESLSKEEAIIEIKRNAGTQFDEEIAKVFIEKVLSKY